MGELTVQIVCKKSERHHKKKSRYFYVKIHWQAGVEWSRGNKGQEEEEGEKSNQKKKTNQN